MANNTVASLAIKLGIDASAIPAQLRAVTVNLTTEQRRMATQQRDLASTMVAAARESAEKNLEEAKWIKDSQLAYERQIAEKRIAEERRVQQAALEAQKKEAALAAEIKSTAQSGVLSFRMLSESMDVGLSRPLTRYLTQTFPGLSSALSSIVGFTAMGAGAYYAIAAFDHLTRKLEEAKKREEEYAEAVQKTRMVIGEADAASAIQMDRELARAAKLRGDKQEEVRYKGMAEAAEAVKETAAAVSKLEEAELKEARAAEQRMRTWAAIGSFLHRTFTGADALGVEKINNEMQAFGREFSLRSLQDEIHGTTTASDLLAKSLKDSQDRLAALQAERVPKSVLETLPAKLGDTRFVQNLKDAASHVGAGFSRLPEDFAKAGNLLQQLKSKPGAAPAVELVPAHPQQTAAAQKDVELHQQLVDQQNARKALADQKAKDDALETNRAKASEQANATKRELEAIDKLVNSLRNRANAEFLAAEATGKGSAASIQAAAAATAEKELSDRLSDAQEKFKIGDISARQFEQVKSTLAAATPAVREFALAIETGRAEGEFHKALAEFNLRTREHIAALDQEAAGVGRVVKEQQKQAQGLLGLQERYEGLYGKTVPAAPPAIGPPSAQQADYAELQAARAGVAIEQSKTQTSAFATELKKVQAAAMEASDPSPWNRTEAKLAALQLELNLTAAQTAQLGAVMHDADASGGLAKVTGKVEELRAVHAALLAGSPYPEIEAQVTKMAADLKIPTDQVRALLIEEKQLGSSGKAIEALRAVQPGGAGSRMAELEREAAAVRQMAADNRDNENVQLAARLRLQEIAAQEDQILLKTGGVQEGFRAWLDELKAVQSEAQFVKGLLDQATKGLEANAADTLVRMIESHRNQHQKLIHELRSMWESYFASLAKMALQHGLQKLMQPVTGAIEKALGIVPKDAALVVNTTALTTNTAALSALTAALAAQGAGGGAGAGAGLIGLIPGMGGAAAGPVNAADVPGMMAEGGDVSPGGSFISGEAGAERVDLERGGAHVTPLGGTTGGGDTNHFYDLRGAVVTEDLMRRAEAAQMMAHTESRAVAKAVSIAREAPLRSRPQR